MDDYYSLARVIYPLLDVFHMPARVRSWQVKWRGDYPRWRFSMFDSPNSSSEGLFSHAQNFAELA